MYYMSIAANQYANKVFAEHPISLWSLDDQAYYISLIDDNDRRFSNWTGSGFTTTEYTSLPSGLPESPFPSSNVYSSFIKSTTAAGTIQILSPELFDATNIDANTSTFCVNFFLYHNPTYITAFRVGYKYNNSGGTPQTVIPSVESSGPKIFCDRVVDGSIFIHISKVYLLFLPFS